MSSRRSKRIAASGKDPAEAAAAPKQQHKANEGWYDDAFNELWVEKLAPTMTEILERYADDNRLQDEKRFYNVDYAEARGGKLRVILVATAESLTAAQQEEFRETVCAALTTPFKNRVWFAFEHGWAAWLLVSDGGEN